ncbi:MAG: enoyl-CoA hydratase [Actinomycetota bacterium]|nr:enoyl-CoA hydratase [Actinomycetota bacterium]
MADQLVLVDDPAPRVRRITLNRPEKRNALSNALRGQLFDELRRADADHEARVIVIRGAGPCFSAGYDLGQDPSEPFPRPISVRDGFWSRSLVEGWFEIMDFATPVIAQVHSYCLAGASELAAACDLVYVAEDAQIGYPPVRTMSSPDMLWQPWLLGLRRAMEALLTGDSLTGVEAVAAGYANRAFPAAELETEVLRVAERVAKVPGDLLTLNKRAVHRAMEAMGMRTGIRATTELQALGLHQRSSKEYMPKLRDGVTAAVDARDEAFGDYRTQHDRTP